MRKELLFVTILLIAALTTAAAQEAKPTAPPSADAPGYVGMFELGFLYGESNNFNQTSLVSPSLQLFNGYRFHRLLVVGGTLGFDFYQNGMISPLALGFRGNILNSRVSPFYSFDAGYGFSYSTDTEQSKKKGGWMLNPAIGLKVSNTNNTALSFSLGYKTQRAFSEYKEWNTITQQQLHFKRMSVRLGYIF